MAEGFIVRKGGGGDKIETPNGSEFIVAKATELIESGASIKIDRVNKNLLKLNEPDVILPYSGRSVDFSFDGTYLAVGHEDSPYISIYKRDGDTFTKLANPSVLPGSQSWHSVNGLDFSSDSIYLALAHTSFPYISIYKRDGDTFTKLPDPSVLPTDTGRAVAFSPDGVYLAVGHGNSPYISIYKRDGDTFTKLANPSVLPGSQSWHSVYGLDFSSDSIYLAVGHLSSPFLSIYKRDGDTFTKLPDPSVLPTWLAESVSFSNDDTYLAVAYSDYPFLNIYKRDGDTFNKLPDPSVLPTNSAIGVAFSNDDAYLAVAHSGLPTLTIYKRDGDTFTKTPNPSVLPAVGGGEGGDGDNNMASLNSAFAPDGSHLVVVSNESPYVIIYKIDPTQDLLDSVASAKAINDAFVNFNSGPFLNTSDLGFTIKTMEVNEESKVVSVWRRQ
jgi:WD40 repeat protein